MPSIFSRTLATVNVDNTWKWSNYVPDALIINLGNLLRTSKPVLNDPSNCLSVSGCIPDTYCLE